MESARGRFRILLVAFSLFFAGVVSAQAEKRVALLIGNGAYSSGAQLINPRNDVEALRVALKGAGFDFIDAQADLNRASMVRALRNFEEKAQGSDIAVVFYSGHGIEFNGQNYLIPVDAKLDSDRDIDDETLSLDRVLRAIDGATKLKLVLLDACRDNPFNNSMKRSLTRSVVSRGLARVDAADANMLIAYAAAPGQLALDGDGRNSPFTSALVKHLLTPGLDVRLALGKIRDEVSATTGRRQIPFQTGSLGGDLIQLAPAAPNRNPATAGVQIGSLEAGAIQSPPATADGKRPPTTSGNAARKSKEELISAAKKEGQLTVIALPRDWCGYGALIDGFKAKYGISVNELNPDAGSGDEVEAIKASKGNRGQQGPDVIDVGLSFALSAKAEGLIAPYKVSNWASIPEGAKDVDGYWYGDYYGVLVFEVNKDVIKTSPADWADLLKPEFKNAVALAGDPRASSQAIQGVYAAGLAAARGDAAKAGTAGLEFFARLHKAGNFVPVVGKAASLARGATPIVLRWDYNALADRDTLKGNPPIDVVVPKSGVVAGFFAQAISAFAPHPAAAELWMEYLYSDEGQIGFLKGYCHPIRFTELAATNKIPADLLAKFPPTEAYARADFPTLAGQIAAKEVITGRWDAVVGANVTK